MPAIFFLSLPPMGESTTGGESRSPSERDGMHGYSGQLSFDGSFDQYGFVPRRTYAGGAEAHAGERLTSGGVRLD